MHYPAGTAIFALTTKKGMCKLIQNLLSKNVAYKDIATR